MKGKLEILALILMATLLFASCKSNRDDARILPKEQEKSLVALGQLWGFLKYHHPAVAEGKYDWDAELVKLIPPVVAAQSEQEWKTMLDNWVDSLPPVPAAKKDTLPEAMIKVRPDYGELFNADYFNPKTIEKLKFILDNAVILSNHYVGVDNISGQLSITNEPSYEEMMYPELPYRLLALFKHWNIVNYFFPYRELCDQKWSEVFVEMLPEFIHAANQEQYMLACLKLLTKIDDSHGFFNDNGNLVFYKWCGLFKAPIEAKFIEDKLVVTMITGDSARIQKEIQIGDVITKIDGEEIDKITERLLPYTPASNYTGKLRNILLFNLLKTNENTMKLTILSDGQTVEKTVFTYSWGKLKIPQYSNPRPEEEGYRVLDNNIGYILPSNCKVEDRDSGIKKVLDGTKGVIIDMRCYPSDYISYPILRYLGSHLRYSSLAYVNVSYPGYFLFVNGLPQPDGNKNQQNLNYKNKIIVIVNEQTQSQAEDHVLGYQLIPNATVIGSTTAGANGKVVNFSLPGGIVTSMTGLGVYYPDGSDLQRVGVKIDEIVKPTIAGIKAGRDELLERAIEIINTTNTTEP